MDESPLARLPAELRNNIYGHALQHSGPFKIKYGPSGPRRHILPGSKPEHVLAITAACKQTRAESVQLFYAINTFNFRSPIESPNQMAEFCKQIGCANTAALRSVAIVIPTELAVSFSLNQCLRDAEKLLRRECRVAMVINTFSTVLLEIVRHDLRGSVGKCLQVLGGMMILRVSAQRAVPFTWRSLRRRLERFQAEQAGKD